MRYTVTMHPVRSCISGEGAIQLPLAFIAEPPPIGAERPLVTRVLARHPSRRRILKMVDRALDFFPELEGVPIRIGIARGAQGYASLGEPAIWLNPRGLCYQTIAHELVHLLQARGEVPLGERSCDLYSLARDLLLVDAAPVYLEMPSMLLAPRGRLTPGAARLLFDTAREAIARRQRGQRRYIQWFEREIAAKASSPATRTHLGIA